MFEATTGQSARTLFSPLHSRSGDLRIEGGTSYGENRSTEQPMELLRAMLDVKFFASVELVQGFVGQHTAS